MNNKNQTTDIEKNPIYAIARIGSWEFSLVTQLFTIDKISRDILDIPLSSFSLDECSSYFDKGSFTTQIGKGIEVLRTTKKTFSEEIELKTSRNKVIWVHMIGNGTYKDGACVKISGIFQDITKRKEFETSLLQKNELLNFTEKKASLGHWKWNLSTDLVTCSKNIYRIIGVEEDTPITIDMMINSVHPEDVKMVRAHFLSSIEKKSFEKLFHRFLLANGTERTIQVLGEIVADEAGELIDVICISQDITARKQFEEELLKKNQLFQVVQRKAKLGYWQWDFKTNLVTCSENLSDLLGIAKNTEIPVKMLLKDIPSEELKNVRANIAQSIKTNYFASFTHRIVIDGEIRHIQVSGKIITDKNGDVLYILGISQDITEQKSFEHELLEKNRLLNFAEEKAGMGNWQWFPNEDKCIWSKSAYKIFGFPEEMKISSDTLAKYAHPEDLEKVQEHMTKALEVNHFGEIMHRVILDDGRLKYVLVKGGDFIANKEGEVVEIRGTVLDVTEQQKEALKFKSLLESAPNATLIIDRAAIIQMMNKQAENMFGYTKNELIGKIIEVLMPQKLAEKREIIKNVFLNNMEVQNVDIGEDLYMLDKQGKEIPVKITLGPLTIDSELLISVAIWDISEEKLAEQKLIRANKDLELITEELQSQNHQLADFTQITSHNLRAPVSNLNSILDLYNTSESDEEKAELFEKFEIVIDHLTSTLNTLIEVLKTKSEKSIKRKEISFTKTLKKTQDILMSQISKSGAQIAYDFSQIDKLSYSQIYIESIFQNLIGNAIKYRHPERKPEITVTSAMENGTVKLRFADNGLGIDLKRHGHKLFGLNKIFHNHPEAKGVGLFMTRAQIEAMGGKISAESQVGKGSTFSVEF